MPSQLPPEIEAKMQRNAGWCAAILHDNGQGLQRSMLALLPQVRELAQGQLHRELGWASFSDLMRDHGVGLTEAMGLRSLAMVEPDRPRLFRAARAGEVPVETLMALAPAIEDIPDDEALTLAQRLDVPALRRHVRQQKKTPRRRKGIEYRRQEISLSPDAETMLADLVASRSQAQQKVISRSEAIREALLAGVRRLDRGHYRLGERRYRRVDLGEAPRPHGVRALTLDDRFVGTLPQPDWRVARTAEVSETRHEPGWLDPNRRDRQRMADQLRQDLLDSVWSTDRRHYIVARTLSLMEEYGLHRQLGCNSLAAVGKTFLGWSRSQISQLTRVGHICREHKALRRLFRDGRIRWTAIRALAPIIDEDNLDDLLELMQTTTVSDLEEIAGNLAPLAESRRRRRLGIPGDGDETKRRTRITVELPTVCWHREFRQLQQLIADARGVAVDKVSDADVLEEALWHGCDSFGPPQPIGGAYRINLYRLGDVAWQNALEGTTEVPMTRFDELADLVHYDLDAELKRAEHYEADRLERDRDRPCLCNPNTTHAAPCSCSSGVANNGRRPFNGRRPGSRWDQRIAWRPWVYDALRAPEIPPWMKVALYFRSGGRCSNPGCTSWLFLHQHHIVRRFSGGGNHPLNLLCLCSGCHGKVHSLGWELTRRPKRATPVPMTSTADLIEHAV